MTAESLPRQRKFRYRAAANSCPLIFSPPNSLLHTLDVIAPLLSSSLSSPLYSQASLTLTWSTRGFPGFSVLFCACRKGEALWSTSISITCQDLWVMESEPDCSESVLLKLTSEPLWAVMDEHLSTPLPLPYTYCTSPSVSPFLSLTLRLSVYVLSLFHHLSPLTC